MLLGFRTAWCEYVLGMYLLLSVFVVVGCQPHYITKSTRYSAATSADRYEFQSTVFQPMNVAVTDSLSGQTLWRKDIPTDYTLIVDLDRKGEVEFMGVTGKPATEMAWFVYGPEKGFAVESGKVALPGTPVLVQASLREIERPQDTTNGGQGLSDESQGSEAGGQDLGTGQETTPDAGGASDVNGGDHAAPAIQVEEEHTEAAEFSRPSRPVGNSGNDQDGGLVPGNSVGMEPVDPEDVDPSSDVPSLKAEDLPAVP